MVGVVLASAVLHDNGSDGSEVLSRYLSFLGALIVLVDLMSEDLPVRRVLVVFVTSCAAAGVIGLIGFVNGVAAGQRSARRPERLRLLHGRCASARARAAPLGTPAVPVGRRRGRHRSSNAGDAVARGDRSDRGDDRVRRPRRGAPRPRRRRDPRGACRPVRRSRRHRPEDHRDQPAAEEQRRVEERRRAAGALAGHRGDDDRLSRCSASGRAVSRPTTPSTSTRPRSTCSTRSTWPTRPISRSPPNSASSG